ncbi:hypothetical protein ACQY0O_005482 [Thecaphora frezii]
MLIKSISSPVSGEVLEPVIHEAPQPVHRGGRILRQLRHWRITLTSAIRPGKRRREHEQPETHGDTYEPGQPKTALIGMPDEDQLSLGFSPEHRLVLDLAVSTPSPTPSLSNGSDFTPASTPSAEILTFDDAATAPSAPSTASLPRNSLCRVDRLALCTTSPVSPGHDEAPVSRQDEVYALANILPLLGLEDDTTSVIELNIQRQSFESDIVDPAFIPTTQLQDEVPQHTDNAPLDDLETIYEDDEEDEDLVDLASWDDGDGDDNDNGDKKDNGKGFDLETIYEDDEEAEEACFALEDPVDVFTWDDEEDDIAANLPEHPSAPILFFDSEDEDDEALLTLHKPISITAWGDDEEDDIAANLPERPSAPLPFLGREEDDDYDDSASAVQALSSASVYSDNDDDDITASLPERPSTPMSFYFLEHDAPLATTTSVREIDDMEPSSDSCDSSNYNNLFELSSSSNLSDSDNTEPTDDDLLSLVEPMEKPLAIPEIQINGIPLHLLDDAWECEPEHQHQHQHDPPLVPPESRRDTLGTKSADL